MGICRRARLYLQIIRGIGKEKDVLFLNLFDVAAIHICETIHHREHKGRREKILFLFSVRSASSAVIIFLILKKLRVLCGEQIIL